MVWFYCFWIECIIQLGNIPRHIVFIHRGMPRRTMLAEDVRDEGPRRRINPGSIVRLSIGQTGFIFRILFILGMYNRTEHCTLIHFVWFVCLLYVLPCGLYILSVKLADMLHQATVVKPRDRGVPNTFFPSVNRIPQPKFLFANQFKELNDFEKDFPMVTWHTRLCQVAILNKKCK